MLQSIRSFFSRNVETAPETPPAEGGADRRLQIAACALLLELAHADNEFSGEERTHIEQALVRHFALDEVTARELMELADAERREAVDLFQFARLIVTHYDEGQRMLLAEVMWGVVHADGDLSRHEHYLMQKLSSLLELRPGFLSEAKKRALGKKQG